MAWVAVGSLKRTIALVDQLDQRWRVKRAILALPLVALFCSVPVAGTALPAAIVAVDRNKGRQIDRFIAEETSKRHIAGLSLAVISGGRVRYAKGYGLADLRRRKPVTADTSFLIASISKMFTAIGTMLLVQDGKVNLDEAVGTYVADLPPAWRPVTVRQLLAHTSGINNFTAHDTPPCGPIKDQASYKQEDVIAEVSCLPLDFAPGTDWSYSDTGYFVLGLLIEHVSGLKYDTFLRRRIFVPLGMRNTRLMGPMGVDDGRATGYSWNGQRLTLAPILNPVIEGPSGGLVSTVRDLAKFDDALGRGLILPQPVLQKMWEPLGIGSAKYGLGFALRPINGRRQIGHTGGGPGAATSFARFVDDDFTVIVLTNTAQRPQSIQEIAGGIADIMLGAPARN